MSLKRLPRDDLPITKPEGPCALALVSDFTRSNPSNLDFPEPDHDDALCHEALRDDARLHVFEPCVKPIADLVLTMQARPAWSLQFDLGIVQGKKLVNVASLVVELGPSTCDCDVLLRHRRISIFESPPPGKLGRILAALSVLVLCDDGRPGPASSGAPVCRLSPRLESTFSR